MLNDMNDKVSKINNGDSYGNPGDLMMKIREKATEGHSAFFSGPDHSSS
jgi:hypothetical protein